jgi:hypothetical protein
MGNLVLLKAVTVPSSLPPPQLMVRIVDARARRDERCSLARPSAL